MDSNYIALQNRQEDEITDIVSEIPKSIADLKKLLKSNHWMKNPVSAKLKLYGNLAET